MVLGQVVHCAIELRKHQSVSIFVWMKYDKYYCTFKEKLLLKFFFVKWVYRSGDKNG